MWVRAITPLLAGLTFAGFLSPQQPAAPAPRDPVQQGPAARRALARRVFTNDDLEKGPARTEVAELHFRIAVPRGWSAHHISKNEFTVPCPDSEEPKCGLAVVVHELPRGAIENTSKLLDGWRRKILDEGTHETVVWRERTVDGLPAGEHRIAFNDPGPGQMHLVYVLLSERRRLYVVGLRAPNSVFNGHLAAFEEFLASFEPTRD